MSSNASRTPVSAVSSASTSLSSGWRLCYALCLYDFASSDPDHLPFRKNEILEIVEKEASGWWAALRDDRIGWVPSSFLAELSHEDAERLMSVQEELRVYEYEVVIEPSRPLFESAIRPPISSRAGYGYNAADDDNWVPILEPGGKVTVFLCFFLFMPFAVLITIIFIGIDPTFQVALGACCN